MYASAALLILVILLSVFILIKYRSSSNRNTPPVKSGWIPWVGVAVEFGKEPLHYIENTRKELGDVFTIVAAGKRMTFLCDHSSYRTFFQSQHASFGAAVQPFTQAAANVSKKSFLAHHSSVHDTVKGKLTPSYTAALCSKLSNAFRKRILLCLPPGEAEMDLMTFVQESMFPAVVGELFGEENLSLTNDELFQLLNTFKKYDQDFEYGVELPSIFLREWSQCKNKLLEIFKGVVERVQKRRNCPELLVEHLISAVDSPNAPGYTLLLLWATQANAVPVSFWLLAFILSKPEVLSDVQKELNEWSLDTITEDSLGSIPSIKRAMMEAIRLRSPGMITRKITKSMTIKGYTIPAGNLLMLSPYWSHRNPTYFPEPEEFNPKRWLECDLDKGQFLPGFVAFGGGRYQCPGRWFALMEIHLYVAMVLKMLDITLLDPVPQPSPLHLVGTQQPANHCRIRIQRRE